MSYEVKVQTWGEGNQKIGKNLNIICELFLNRHLLKKIIEIPR